MDAYKSVINKFIQLVIAEGTPPPIVAHRAAVLFETMRYTTVLERKGMGMAVLSKLFPKFKFPVELVSGAEVVIAQHPEPQQEPYIINTSTDWAPTLPLYQGAALPSWGNTKPFAIDLAIAKKFIGSGIGEPTVGSIGTVYELGRAVDNPTEEQAKNIEIATFWAGNGGTCTPPGQFIEIALQLAEAANLSDEQVALFFHRLGVAIADAGIAAWKIKYAQKIRRPIDIINSTIDKTWKPFIATPNHPTFPSGHSTFSSAAGEIIKHMIGNVPFSYTSVIHVNGLPFDSVKITRSFENIDQAIIEAGYSRILGGIHFTADDVNGRELGKLVAKEVTAKIK